MGCKSLTYSDFSTSLKVVHRDFDRFQNTCAGAYRFGYNGMEKDDEAKDNGNSYTTEFRQYDPRLGRWLSLDPKMAEFPQWSPYVAFNDNPVMYVDPDGLEGVEPTAADVKNGNWVSPSGTKMNYTDGVGWHRPEVVAKNNNLVKQNAPSSGGVGYVSKVGNFSSLKGVNLSFALSGLTQPLSSSKNPFENTISQQLPETQVQWQASRAKMETLNNGAEKLMYGTTAVVTGGVLAFEAPAMVTSFLNSLKMYHNTIGMNGGYVNIGLNWVNQSYTQGGSIGDYLSFEGKSITGLILSGTLKFNSTIGGQLFVGAADPWLNATYTSKEGLTSSGYFLNYSAKKPSLQKTTALTIMGAFGPMYQLAPLSKSGGANFIIEQGLMAPGQKAVQNGTD